MIKDKIKSTLFGLAVIAGATAAGIWLGREYGKIKYLEGILDNSPIVVYVTKDGERENCMVYTRSTSYDFTKATCKEYPSKKSSEPYIMTAFKPYQEPETFAKK